MRTAEISAASQAACQVHPRRPGTLARRFAVGEIDENEYHGRLEALRSQQYADTAYHG